MIVCCYRTKIQKLTQNISLNICKFSTSGNGDIRGAGGTFGKKEKAQEDQYFRQKEKEELSQFKKKLDDKTTEKKSDSKKNEKSPSTK